MADNDKILSLINNIAAEQNLQNYKIKLKRVSNDGANYTSYLVVATITSINADDLHLFVKVAAMGEEVRKDTHMDPYSVEKIIYTELMSTFRGLEDKHGLAERHRLKTAKYYGASTIALEEMIVLEDLSSRGFVCHDRLKSVDWEYAAQAIIELTKLHSLTIAFQHENPEKFVETYKVFTYDKVKESKGMQVFWEISRQTALKAVRQENKERLKKFLYDLDLKDVWDLFAPSRREVMIHGDFRPSNLMHCRQDDGSLEVITLDYQTMRSGCPVVDLYYFIFNGTDAQFRAHYYQRLIEHYYSELRAALVRLGLDPDEKYPRENFEFELKEKLPFGLAMAVYVLPIVTVETEDAPKLSDTMKLSDFSIQRTSSLFPERLNGVVDDYVRWGVI